VVIFPVVVTLRAVRPDGQLDPVHVTGRGGTVACAFGRVGFRSAIWTITVTPDADVAVTTDSRTAETRISGPESDHRQDRLLPRQHDCRPPSADAYRTAERPLIDAHEPADVGGAPHITTKLAVLVLPEDVQSRPGDTAPDAGVHWSDPPPPGWAAMFQVLLLAGRSGWEYVLHDIGAIVAAFGTRTGDAVLITSQRTPLNDQEQAALAAVRAGARDQLNCPQ
jgi:hypothetical protein